MKKILRKLVSKRPTTIPPEPDHHAYKKAHPKKHHLKLLFMGCAGILLIAGFVVVFQSMQKTDLEKLQPKSINPTTTFTPSPNPSPTLTENHSIQPISTAQPAKTVIPTATQKAVAKPTSTPTPPPPDTSPPNISMTGPEDGGIYDFSNFCFPVNARDDSTGSTDILIRYNLDNSGWSEWKKEYAPCFSNVPYGNHTFMLEAKDGPGNVGGVNRSFKTEAGSSQ